MLGWIITITAEILFDVFGNYLYMRHVEEEAVLGLGMREPQKSEYLDKKGGTSAVAVWIYFGVVTVFMILWMLLLQNPGVSIYY